MTTRNHIVISSDHAAIPLRLAIAAHIAAKGLEVNDIGPSTPDSTPYPKGQGVMMAANKINGIRCGVCADAYSARMIRQHNDANMLSIGARVVGEGLALDIVDAFLTAQFEGGRHAVRVEMIRELEG